MKVTQERARRTQQLVLDSAAEEFATHGFARTNLRDVVARTGLTKGALYGHFTSKEELAAELTREFAAGWRRQLRQAEEPECADSPLRALNRLLLGLATLAQQDVRFLAGLRLASEEARAHGELPAAMRELRSRAGELIRSGQRAGEIHDSHDSEIVAHLALSLLLGACHTTLGAEAGQLAARLHGMWEVLAPALRH